MAVRAPTPHRTHFLNSEAIAKLVFLLMMMVFFGRRPNAVRCHHVYCIRSQATSHELNYSLPVSFDNNNNKKA